MYRIQVFTAPLGNELWRELTTDEIGKRRSWPSRWIAPNCRRIYTDKAEADNVADKLRCELTLSESRKGNKILVRVTNVL